MSLDTRADRYAPPRNRTPGRDGKTLAVARGLVQEFFWRSKRKKDGDGDHHKPPQ